MGNGQFSVYIDKELVEKAKEKYAETRGEKPKDVKISHMFSKALKMFIDFNPTQINFHALFEDIDELKEKLEEDEEEYLIDFIDMINSVAKKIMNRGRKDEGL